jgi:hypothetical protein
MKPDKRGLIGRINFFPPVFKRYFTLKLLFNPVGLGFVNSFKNPRKTAA